MNSLEKAQTKRYLGDTELRRRNRDHKLYDKDEEQKIYEAETNCSAFKRQVVTCWAPCELCVHVWSLKAQLSQILTHAGLNDACISEIVLLLQAVFYPQCW